MAKPPRYVYADGVKVDLRRLNDAMWAACNMRYDTEAVPSMEKASEAARNAVCSYLGIDRAIWDAEVLPAFERYSA